MISFQLQSRTLICLIRVVIMDKVQMSKAMLSPLKAITVDKATKGGHVQYCVSMRGVILFTGMPKRSPVTSWEYKAKMVSSIFKLMRAN